MASKSAPEMIGDYKIKKQVTLPLWKWKDGEQKFLKILTKMGIGKSTGGKSSDGRAMEPATTMQVVNLDTGELCEVICPAVLKGNLEESYPSAGYVGKAFALTQSKIENKRYKGFAITEIEA